jgi:hypothetical protein
VYLLLKLRVRADLVVETTQLFEERLPQARRLPFVPEVGLGNVLLG